MNVIVIGNLVVLFGAVIMVGVGFLKKKNHILLAQCLQYLIMGIGNLILGGVTGFISNIVSILRNLVCLKLQFTVQLKIFFMAIQVLLSVYFNTAGFIGYLPVIAACLLTWFLDTQSEKTLKVVLAVSQIMWLIYDVNIMNYIGCAFDIMAIVSNLIGIFMVLKDNKKSVQNDILHA